MLFAHLIYISILSWFVGSPPQALTYDVIVHNRSIGQLNVTKVPTTTGVQYRVNADVAVRLFGEKRMITRFTSTYRNNLLTESSFNDQLNGRTKHDALVRWDGSRYHIRVNDASSIIANRRATYSAASLYDREPVGVSELFSERHGRFCSLRSVATHAYELTLPDGKKNYYRYVNGVCREVEVEQPLFTVFFRLRSK
jgi:hypothetical protein